MSGIGIAAGCKPVASALHVRVVLRPFWSYKPNGKAVVLKTTVGSDALAGSSPVCGALLFYHAKPQIFVRLDL